ncbi:MAG: polymer-forming cytoskeletal protein [Desulfobacterales bacterium]|jgi:cytoskeletal protein CcmA (bactofilin family)|nr:polymer-forming cytoskeletal protein [Desulfobacterales bacterium]
MTKSKTSDALTMLLGPGTAVEGTIEFKDTVRLEGSVNGTISSSDGTVILGEKAEVQGDIRVNIAIIRGKVNGKIEARTRIELYPPARIEGDIQSRAVSIQSGVIFNGNCSMKV